MKSEPDTSDERASPLASTLLASAAAVLRQRHIAGHWIAERLAIVDREADRARHVIRRRSFGLVSHGTKQRLIVGQGRGAGQRQGSRIRIK